MLNYRGLRKILRKEVLRRVISVWCNWNMTRYIGNLKHQCYLNNVDISYIIASDLDILTISTINKHNKRPMGYIAHLRNKFKSINTFVQSYEYIKTLI